MKHKNKYFFVFIIVLALFALLAVNSQTADQDTGLDTKLIPIDKPTALGVYIPVEDAEAYVPLKYKFDDKFNYRLKAIGGDVHFKIVFRRALAYKAADWEAKLILLKNTETHFWPWRPKSIKVMGSAYLVVIKRDQNKDIPKARVYNVANYTKKIPKHLGFDKSFRDKGFRSMGFSTENGDLWMFSNGERVDLQIVIQQKGFSSLPAHRSVIRPVWSEQGAVDILVPRRWATRPANITARFIGNFVLIAGDGSRRGKHVR